MYTQYGAVIDAGSSHTMMYVYRWEVPTLTFTGTSTGAVKQVFKCPDNSSQSSKTLLLAVDTCTACMYCIS